VKSCDTERVREICREWIEFVRKNTYHPVSDGHGNRIPGEDTVSPSRVMPHGREVLNELRTLLGDAYDWDHFRVQMAMNHLLAGNLMYVLCREAGLIRP
jgi:hypothetical protein